MHAFLYFEIACKSPRGGMVRSSIARSFAVFLMSANWSSPSKIEKDCMYPIFTASLRRIRAQSEWNVPIHRPPQGMDVMSSTRRFISAAALLVNVAAKIWLGARPLFWIRYAIFAVSTRVLPVPAPAKTSWGPSGWTTASCCTLLRTTREVAGTAVGELIIL